MKITKGQTKVILALLGIVILVAAFFLGIRPLWEDKKALDDEVAQLQTRYDDLVQKEARRAEFEQGIIDYTKQFENVLSEFPVEIVQEKSIMFMQGVEDNNEFTIDTVGIGQPVEFYRLGGMVAQDGEVAATDTADTTATVASASDYVGYYAEFPITYTGTYEGIKDFLRYIGGYSERMAVTSMNIALSDGEYVGDVNVDFFAVAGGNRTADSLIIEGVDTGVENIFQPDASSNPSTGDYDGDGAAIVNDYDHFIMLSPESSDASATIVGQNDASESTYLTTNNNDVEQVTIRYFMKEGKYYVSYMIGNESYPADYSAGVEFDPGKNLNLLVMSSARIDKNDTSGIKLAVINETDMTLNIKILDDDATSPRCRITSKEGKVAVYR